METKLHRRRLIDHLQLVVRDPKASQDFYTAVLAVLCLRSGQVHRARLGRQHCPLRCHATQILIGYSRSYGTPPNLLAL